MSGRLHAGRARSHASTASKGRVTRACISVVATTLPAGQYVHQSGRITSKGLASCPGIPSGKHVVNTREHLPRASNPRRSRDRRWRPRCHYGGCRAHCGDQSEQSRPADLGGSEQSHPANLGEDGPSRPRRSNLSRRGRQHRVRRAQRCNPAPVNRRITSSCCARCCPTGAARGCPAGSSGSSRGNLSESCRRPLPASATRERRRA